MSRVLIRPSDYDRAVLRGRVFDMLDALAPLAIRPGDRVLVKPNFLVPAGPEAGVVTHPLVTRAVVEYVLDKGGRPQVSDSPAMGSFERVLRESGTQEALRDLPVVCKPFEKSVSVEIGQPFGRIDIAEDALAADAIINLPKLKTHNLTGLTLGVKNLFGCIVGLKKPEWHAKMGTNVEMLCRLFILLHERLKPRITLLDGILALEGEGPGRSGTPRHVGVLMAATDTYLLDEAACRLVGADPERLPVTHLARRMGFMPDPAEAIRIVQDAGLKIPGLDLPEIGLPHGLNSTLQAIARRLMLSLPVADPERCNLCGSCRDICPASAISLSDRRLAFDYDRCIRCFCCGEICPQGAVRIQKKWLGRLWQAMISR